MTQSRQPLAATPEVCRHAQPDSLPSLEMRNNCQMPFYKALVAFAVPSTPKSAANVRWLMESADIIERV